MRILELCLSPDLGGLELYMARASKALAATDEVLAVTLPDGKVRKYLDEAGIRRRDGAVAFRPLPLLAAAKLARLIDRESMDVIHIHWGKDLPLAALAKWFSRRKPRLVYTRQMQITRPKEDLYHNFLYRQVDVLVTITQLLAQTMRGFLRPELAEKVRHLYYGVTTPERSISSEERSELRASWGVPDEAFLVGLIARIEPFKGQHLLLEALTHLPDMHAVIVGHAMDEEYLRGLKARAAEPDLAGRVHFQGFAEQPQRLMQACDCVALTTVEETFGLVLAEAMRAGVAVVGSDRGGVPEIIVHRESGLLFRSQDAVSLEEQLRTLANDPQLRARLAEGGKRRADDRFDNQRHFEALREILTPPR